MADAQPQNGELAISKAPKNIYSRTNRCLSLFSKYRNMSVDQNPYQLYMAIYEVWFLFWVNTSSCLDRRLKFYPDMKELVMSMLSVLQRALRLASISHPLARTVVETDGALYGITGAISRLERLDQCIRNYESPAAREAREIRRLVATKWGDGSAALVWRLIHGRFPRAEPTLITQLVLSILHRRYRIIYHLLKYEKAMENANPGARRSQQREMADDTLLYPASYPDPPEVARGESKANCRYCFRDIVIPQSASRKQRRAQWESHLKADLKPYACLSEYCRHIPKLFSTADEWKDHMEMHNRYLIGNETNWFREIHRTKWPCPFCNDSNTCFITLHDLQNHLIEDEVTNHPDITGWDTSMLRRSRVPNPRDKYCCPLCNMEQKGRTPKKRSDRLYTHFIDHLEELALVSIYGWNVEISKITGQSISSTHSVDVGERNSLRRRSGPNHDQRKSMKRKILDCAKRFRD
ncbi:uncharacterized protein G6M90_00g054630 [Metarhizium brunneum]|uniref:C2H2-type domain-containing protein n=1 Tax=Metarhizium brunneum TaxID=500148 RepID=A0A7D5Z2Y0_9HYPO|nr:hypothetical protein G6M90_00g054630 [Metarhizium brunneum]